VTTHVALSFFNVGTADMRYHLLKILSYSSGCMLIIALLPACVAVMQGGLVQDSTHSIPSALPATINFDPLTLPLSVVYENMVYIPGGFFFRGNQSDPFNPDEFPSSLIKVDGYWLDMYEVTVMQFLNCVNSGCCDGSLIDSVAVNFVSSKKNRLCNGNAPDRFNHPINCVSWYQAIQYCFCMGKRLPTEAEWEKAARGPYDARQLPWSSDNTIGYEDIIYANLADKSAREKYPNLIIFENYDDGYAETSPIGSFPKGSSLYNVFDMIGNVAEWIYDWYDSAAYFRNEDNPRGPESGTMKVYRGHAFNTLPNLVRITRRSALLPSDRAIYLGFRCVAD
jgi:formylglycine-generating enzyme required for sulfatase activity